MAHSICIQPIKRQSVAAILKQMSKKFTMCVVLHSCVHVYVKNSKFKNIQSANYHNRGHTVMRLEQLMKIYKPAALKIM